MPIMPPAQLVLEIDLLADGARHMLADEARHEVQSAAGRERHDEPDRSRRIGLGHRHPRQHQRRRRGGRALHETTAGDIHGASSICSAAPDLPPGGTCEASAPKH
jgi:hypothetical protein